MWMKNPERFKFEYFMAGGKLNTKYLDFGKNIAKLIEDNAHEELLPGLKRYDVSEYEIRCEIAGVPILAYIDSYDPDENVFLEYKTGKIPWTQAKVQKHDQLTLYATALKWKLGKMPEHCDLIWIETVDAPKESDSDTFWRTTETEVKATGRMMEFHRTFDEREIVRTELLIVKCAEEIDRAYREFINGI